MKFVTPVQILFLSNQKTHRSCYIFIFKYLLTNKIFIPNKNNYFWLIENNNKKLLVFLWKKSEYFRSERKKQILTYCWHYHLHFNFDQWKKNWFDWQEYVTLLLEHFFYLCILKLLFTFSISEFTLLSKIHVNMISSIRSLISWYCMQASFQPVVPTMLERYRLYGLM